MLYYHRIDIKERTDPNKSNKNRECMICHYWFFNHGFKFQDSVCSDCHDLTMLSVNKSNMAIMIVKNVYYYCIIYNISKFEAYFIEKFILKTGAFFFSFSFFL